MVDINPKSFRDTPLAELCFEDALKAGTKKSDKLKSSDFKETSIRFCIDGLRDWYSAYVDDYLDGSLYNVIRDISWHWASFCETDTTLVRARTEFTKLRKEITEKTAYTDLVERMKQSARIREFGYVGRNPYHVSLPLEVVGIVGRTGAAIGLPFSKFFQVGMGWSLSTNRQGLYATWLDEVFSPLFISMLSWSGKKIDDLAEVRAILQHRQGGE